MTDTLRYENVYSFSVLQAAFRKARRAKHGKGDEPRFYLNLESNLLALGDQLRTQAFIPDPYRYFSLQNKKERVVSEASFRDRVVHHALVGLLEPVWEDLFISNSFACRKNKGSHRALSLAQELSNKYGYFLKLDIRKYFDHISHVKLLDLLAQQIDDDGILWLCEILMRNAMVPGIDHVERRGVPIGNLTSQFWANVYLNPLDQMVCATLTDGQYLRYMDDILIFANNPGALWRLEKAVGSFVKDELALELKAKATVMAPVREGIHWLGFRVFPGMVRLDHESKIRFFRKIRGNQKLAEWTVDSCGDDRVIASASSLYGHVIHCNSLMLRRSLASSLMDV